MIRFKRLTFKNFMSYGNVPTVVTFDKQGTTLINGENLDEASQGPSSNGSGKSTLINALVYGVYGKPLANVSKNKLINNINEKDMEVVVEFDKEKDQYVIRRYRKKRSAGYGNVVTISRNGKEITPDSVYNTDDFIKNVIGISYDLFVRIVVFSATHLPFLDLPLRSPQSASQSDLIEQLFDLRILSVKAEALKVIMKDAERDFELKELKAEQIKKERDRHLKQLENARTRVEDWEKNRQTETRRISEKLKMIEGVDVDSQRGFHKALIELNGELKDIAAAIKKVESNIKTVSGSIQKIENDLFHLRDDKCPFCLQKYKDAPKKIKALERELKELKIKLDINQSKLTSSTEIESKISENAREINLKITVQNIDELITIKSESDSLLFRLDQLSNATNPHLESYDELKSVKLESSNSKELNELSSLMEHQKFLLKLLTKRDSFVRKKLLDRNLPYLNARLEEYLETLGLPHVVRFTEEMTANISRFGKELDFGNLSAGQRARLNLALAFAFRDVLQRMYMPINVCMLDEVLDVALDEVGVVSAVAMIRNKAKLEKAVFFIISHRDEISGAFDRNITVRMKNGFSRLFQ